MKIQSEPQNLISGYSDINEFPHMVAVGFDSKNCSGYEFLSDGSLISGKFV